MGFAEDMRLQCSSAWQIAVQHRFIKALKQKCLATDVFSRYLLQDYAFLGALLSAFGHALGHAPSLDAKKRITAFMHHLCVDEVAFFVSSFKDVGVPPEVYHAYEAVPVPTQTAAGHPNLTSTTTAFQEILKTASQEGYAQALAVLVPCEWVYQTWASSAIDGQDGEGEGKHEVQPTHERQEQHGAAADAWVGLHTDTDFSLFVEWLRAELNREAEAADQFIKERLAEIFAKTVDLEVAFFDAAYASGSC